MKATKRLLILVMLLSIVLSLGVSASAAGLFDTVDAPEVGGQFYLIVDIEGTEYYYRHTKSGESVTSTAPYSLYLTSDPADKNIKEFTLEASGDGFQMYFPSGDKNLRVYSYDVDGDGVVDTGLNAASVADRHGFFWDAENKVIYQMKSGVKYILCARKLLSSKSGAEEWRMQTVPESEVSDANKVFPVRFAKKHVCSFGEDWASDENSHWHPCFCGEKKAVALHDVTEWTTTKEPAVGVEGSRTGKCTVCGAEVTEVIDALKEETPATDPSQETQAPGASEPAGSDGDQTSISIDPIGLAAVIVLAVTGLAVMIWGKKKDKK